MALWNKTTGMYYHNNCSLMGSIDAVCPRGWCYDVGSTYIETANSAPIWHEGLPGSGQKFVIRGARVQPQMNSAKNFKLTNGQKESTFYILDSFLYNFNIKTIRQGRAFASYFWNIHMEGGDQSWHEDNLSKAPGAPSQHAITAQWAFDKQWDPENGLPAVLPYAVVLQPWNKAYDISDMLQLKWLNVCEALSYNVYLGTSKNPPYYGRTSENHYSPGRLSSGKPYYWRIEAVTSSGNTMGALWSFSVR